LGRPEDIQKLQMHARNIVDWGLGSRLEKIKTALDEILTKQFEEKQSQMKRPGGPLTSL